MRTGLCPCGLLIASILISTVSYAQDSVTSQALFEKGVAEMQAGRYETACPAIAESYRLEPIAGTLFASAECEAKSGKIATAAARYQDYLGLVPGMAPGQKVRHRDREKAAQAQVAALLPRIPKLTIVVPSGAPQDMVVKRNGITVGAAALGVELPVDPGQYSFTVQLSDGTAGEQKLTIQENERKRVELEIPKPKESIAITTKPILPVEPKEKSRALLYVAGGLGAAGLVVGGITGFLSMGKKGTADDNCNGTVCNAVGKDAADSGKSLGNISTIGFGVGIVGLATAGILLLSAPKAQPSEGQARLFPIVASDGAQGGIVGLSGRW